MWRDDGLACGLHSMCSGCGGFSFHRPALHDGGGKNARVRVQRVGDPAVTELRTWGAHEPISVKRGTAEEGE